MHIAMLAPIGEPVPPVGYGGTERVVAWLTEALAARGHQITLFASADSQCPVPVRGWPEHALRGRVANTEHLAMEMAHVLRLERELADFDLVHGHVSPESAALTRRWPTPTVHTLHGGIFPGMVPLMAALSDLAWVSISDAQRRPCPESGWVATIHHGLPLDQYPYGGDSAHYLLHLGRICPEKGTHLAIEAARKAGMRLVIAAKVDPVNQRYFEDTIAPMLDPGHIDYVGEVHHDAKIALMQHAAALLFPICWDEPFGLVLVEAMACGVPVVAFARGAVSEIVVEGRTGYIVRTVDEMVTALRRLDRLDPMACRRHVEARFSLDRMVDRYESLYARLAGIPAAKVA